MTYHICNNYNVVETSTNDYAQAVEDAQAIANRDNMPAWIDSDNDTVKVEPVVELSPMDQFRKLIATLPVMTPDELKVEMGIIKAGKSEFSEIQQRMVLVRADQYLIRQ